MAASCTIKGNKWFDKNHHFPGIVSEEIEGAEEILKHLLLSIGPTLESNSCFERDTPPNNSGSSHRMCDGTNKWVQRIIDAVICVCGANTMHIIRDDSIDVVMEMKPGQRSHGGPFRMIQEMRTQILGHLGKQTRQGVNFGGGIGIPSFSTGVIASLGFVQILQLHLIAPGTIDSHFELWATCLLPLMTKSNFVRWYTADNLHQGYERDWDKLQQILYPESSGMHSKPNDTTIDSNLLSVSSKHITDKDQVLLGWKALWLLMTSRCRDLVGGWLNKYNLGDIIGYGMFSTVFGKENKDYVTKVSTSGRGLHILNEVKYLQKLGKRKNYPETLTKIKDYKMHQFSIGGVMTSPLPCVETCPRGTSLIFYLLSKHEQMCGTRHVGKELYWSAVGTIGEGIKMALNLIHQHNVCHNDVSIKNIVISSDNPILTDFGNAAKLGSMQNSFLGTTEFAHRQIHIIERWECRIEYDVASLGFTITILMDSVVAWDGLSSGIVSNPYSTVF